MKKKKILIAPDSFKGSLTAIEVCEAIKEGFLKACNEFEVEMVPMADGGEGTARVIAANSNGDIKRRKCIDHMGREVDVEYGIIDDKNIAVLDIASCCGLEMLDKSIRTPMITSSIVVGKMLKYLLDEGYRNFIIGLGGSGTNDGGIGMLTGLGGRFLDENGRDIKPIGANLISISKIDLSGIDERIFESEIIVACDVSNPMTGKNGATYVFGKQKGATLEELEILETGMKNYVSMLKNNLDKDIGNIPGSGAAGGLGGAFYLLNGKMKSGIELIFEVSNFEKKVKECHMIVTGEGAIDFQTQFGKTIDGVGKLSKKYNKPLIVLTGTIGEKVEELYDLGITSIFSIIDKPKNLEEAFEDARESVVDVSFNIGRLIIE